MSEGFHQGDEVIHPTWGVGAVLGMRPGRRVRVRFERQPHLPRTVRASEVRLVPETTRELVEEMRLAELARQSAAPPARVGRTSAARTAKGAAAKGAAAKEAAAAATAAAGEAPPPKKRARRKRPAGLELAPLAPLPPRVLDPANRASYRQAIEALRSGVVPAEHASDYTVGREGELARIAELLEAGSGLRIAWGDYGTGKTHLLEVAEQMALEKGFLVSRITLDPAEVPPSHPQRLYRAIAEHLRTPGELETGLDPLMRRLAESSDHRLPSGKRASRFLSPYVYATWLDDARTLDWARDYAHGAGVDPHEGRYRLSRCGWPGEPPLTLSDFRTYGRVYVHVVSTLASWARDAGFGGLLLLFDEVEFVDSCDSAHFEFSREALSHYAAVALPPGELGFDPEEDLYRGGHEVHRRLPLRYDDDHPLAAVFALTPEPEIEALLFEMIPGRGNDLWLDELGPAHAGELVERVAALYAAAYPGAAELEDELAGLRARVQGMLGEGEGAPRKVVQAIVQRFDRARLGQRRRAGAGEAPAAAELGRPQRALGGSR